MHPFIPALQTQLQTLPGEESHAEAMPLNRPFSIQALQSAEDFRQSAVGIVVYPHLDAWKSVLIQRPRYDGTHSDQIAFPGGKKDLDDPNLEFTARRECYEEIGLPMDLGICLGRLTNVYIPVSQFIVEPYIFFVEELPKLHADAREVASIIHFDLSILRNDQILQRTDLRFKDGITRKNIPYFAIEGKVVWGATAMMLAELRAVLKRI